MTGRRLAQIDARNTIPRRLVEQAGRHGAKALVRFPREGEMLSYQDLVAHAEAGAARLRQEFGLQAGAAAALYLGNSADYVKAWFSCMFAGLVDVPINHEFRKTTLLFGLATVGAQAAFTDGEGVACLLDPEVRDYLRHIKVLVLAGRYELQAVRQALAAVAHAPAVVELAALTEPGPAASPWTAIEATAPALIRFTSGTTGPAKGIVQSHLHVLSKAAVHNEVLEYAEADVLYSPFPLHHNLASINGLIGTLHAGGTFVSVPKFSASRFWLEARDNGATLAHLLRGVAPLVAAQPPAASDRQHRVRYLWAGQPNRAFEERFNTRFVQIYALGEVGVISYMRGGPEGTASAGYPLPEMDVRIVDALDRPVAAGVVGEITVRPLAPHRVMLCYHENLPATARAFRNLWFHTGDGGYLGEDGQLYFSGRLGDTIRRRGVNISSEQVESELRRHPSVRDCAVIAVPSETGEQEIHACIQWESEPDDIAAAYEDLAAFMSDRLPKVYVPRFLETVDDLPRTHTGKVRKAALRERARFGTTWDRERRSWLNHNPHQ
ncbi:ATP-dependent acyl-CoA ligase [Pigmentiphaga soli]|uniref:ATP-dependent acyl-CoA ligase n=1 Tax=Pigmentiphaga soli TaxID=1007095 RepID=A0ABP8HEP3_9BURK